MRQPFESFIIHQDVSTGAGFGDGLVFDQFNVRAGNRGQRFAAASGLLGRKIAENAAALGDPADFTGPAAGEIVECQPCGQSRISLRDGVDVVSDLLQRQGLRNAAADAGELDAAEVDRRAQATRMAPEPHGFDGFEIVGDGLGLQRERVEIAAEGVECFDVLTNRRRALR